MAGLTELIPQPIVQLESADGFLLAAFGADCCETPVQYPGPSREELKNLARRKATTVLVLSQGKEEQRVRLIPADL